MDFDDVVRATGIAIKNINPIAGTALVLISDIVEQLGGESVVESEVVGISGTIVMLEKALEEDNKELIEKAIENLKALEKLIK
jgi:hypothetical protein